MYRAWCLKLVAVSVFASLFTPLAAAQEKAAAKPEKLLVYFGTYTRGESKGIYCYELDLASGKLTEVGATSGVTNPSFLAIHPSGKFLYAVSEVAEGEKKVGAVTAFALDRKTGALTKLNYQGSGGAGPCHVAVDKTGKVALVANYGGGSVESIPISEDGQLKAPASVIQHKGEVALAKRQGGPHAHSINVDAGNRFAFAADLGLDKILVYKLDAEKGTLTPHDPPFAKVKDGSGPRHFAFHPSGKFAYACEEITSEVTAFTYDAAKGVLTDIQTLSTLPADYKMPGNSTAEVQVHPSGKFVYVSNRGHDSLAIFRVDESTGKLTAAGHAPSGGKTPRNFGIDPTGTYVLAANQATGNVIVLRVDQETGALKPTGASIEIPAPVCVKFLAR